MSRTRTNILIQICALALILSVISGCSESAESPASTQDIASPDIVSSDSPSADIESDSTAADVAIDLVEDTSLPSNCSTELILEEKELEIINGESSDFSFYVPEDAVSVSMTVSGIEGVTYSLAHWIGPATTLVQDGWMTLYWQISLQKVRFWA